MHMKDSHIVHQCLSGDTEEFALLVDKYKDRIFALVYAKVGQFQDAEDLTQDVFLEAYKNLSTLRRRDNFYPWLYSIASNQCKNFHRSQKRQVVTAHLARQDDNHRMDMHAHSEKLRNERVHDALASLPEVHRQVLVLRYMAGMKSKEIAETLRVSPNAINQRLMRARAKLKAVFNEEMIQIMHTTIAERKLQPGFTAHVVELISDAKIQTAPHKTALPFGLSAAGGVILLLLSLSLPHSPLYPLGEWLGGYLPLKTQMVEDGDLPVDSKATRVAILGAEGKDGDFGRRPKPLKTTAAIGFQDHQTWGLPENAIARFGKGKISWGDGAITFSPDGKHLAVLTTIGVWLYDVKTTRELTLFASERSSWGNEYGVTFAPDGTILAAGDRYDIKLWDVSSQKIIATLKGHEHYVKSVAFSPDGGELASGSNDKTIKLWDVSTRKNIATLRGHEGAVQSVAFSPDGTKIASGSGDETINLWDVSLRKKIVTFRGHEHYFISVAFSPDGTILASGSKDKTIKLWDVSTGKNISTLMGHKGRVSSIAFSPDGSKLCSGQENGTVRLWAVDTGHTITTIRGPRAGMYKSVAFSPDGTLVAHTSPKARIVETWDVSTEKNMDTIAEHASMVYSVAFSPDDTKHICALGTSLGVELWDVDTGIRSVALEHRGAVSSVTYSPDGTKLASASSARSLKLWDVSTRKNIASLTGHTASIQSVAFSTDGAKLASGSEDNSVILWGTSRREKMSLRSQDIRTRLPPWCSRPMVQNSLQGHLTTQSYCGMSQRGKLLLD